MSDRCATIVEQLSRLNPFAGAEGLLDPPRPDESSIPRQLPSIEQIPHIQKVIDTLSYNHLPRTIFNLEKHRPLQSVLMTAKEILAEALPIRCLEATFVGLLLTQELKDIDRIPLSFKSQANDNTYRHIVLVIRARTAAAQVRFGALGLSRKSTLMFKPMTFTSLYDLVMNYRREYVALGHDVVDIKLGLPVSHDSTSRFYPCWRYVALRLADYLGSPAPPTTTATTSGVPSGDTKDEKPQAVAVSPHTTHSHEPFSEAKDEEASSSSAVLPSRLEASARAVDEETSAAVATPTNAAPADRPEDLPVSLRAPANALEAFLRQYTQLLSTIADQLNKGIQNTDGATQAIRLCYLDLDLAERDVAAENRRRVELISRCQSPLSPEARRAAANRQLKSSGKPNTGRLGPRRGAGGTGAARATNGATSTAVRRRPPPNKTIPPAATGKRPNASAFASGIKRNSPATRTLAEADKMGRGSKDGHSPTALANSGVNAGFPQVPVATPYSHESADVEDNRSEASHSEHALSRHESVESDIFSSFGGSEVAGGDFTE